MNLRDFAGLPYLLVGAAILAGSLLIQGILGALGVLLSVVAGVLSVIRFIGTSVLLFGVFHLAVSLLKVHRRKGFW
ncbi:MAG TPA: hypothetical protein GXX57_07390 [Firmicutes bacterium]|nr:hypothetical protein [Bacillota bacterium]